MDGNKILLLKRHDYDRSYPSIYCLPGGKLEVNEHPLDCMLREVYEETGLVLDNYNFVIKLSNINFYVSYNSMDDIVISDEHDSYIIVDNYYLYPLGDLTKLVLDRYIKELKGGKII